jgi:hypothetical protein
MYLHTFWDTSDHLCEHVFTHVTHTVPFWRFIHGEKNANTIKESNKGIQNIHSIIHNIYIYINSLHFFQNENNALWT